jgi:hypothetical protein
MGFKTLVAYKLNVEQHIPFLTSKKAYLAYIEYWNSKLRNYGNRDREFLMIDLLYTGYDSLEYVDSWNQPDLLRIEDIISNDGSRNNQEFKNAPFLAISSGIISNLQKSRIAPFLG